MAACAAGGIDPARVDAIATRLMAAENPIALTAYLGRNADAVAALERLALACGIRIAEFNSIDLNVSQDSPCFAGFDPLPLLEQADVGLLLDTDVPFVPQYAKRVEAIDWIQIDIDPLKSDFPMWGFPTDIRVQADCATVLRQVLEVVAARADDGYRKRVVDRIAGWSGAREAADKAARGRSCEQGRARRDQRGLSVRDLEPRAVAGRYRRQRSDPQCAAGAGAYPPHAAATAMSASPAAGSASAAAWRWA